MRRHLVPLVATVLLLSAAMAACQKKTPTKAPQTSSQAPEATQQRAEGASGGSDDSSESSPSRRMIAKEATLQLEASAPAEVARRAESIVRKHQGRVSSSTTSRGEAGIERVESVLSVPADAFQKTLTSIEALGTVVKRSISTEDVTGRHRDLSARLTSQRRMEKRLRTLLDKTDSVDEILKIEKELADVRSRIETLESEKESLEQRVSHSTIRLTVVAPRSSPSEDGILERVGRAVRDGAEQSADVVAGLLYVGIALSPLALLGLAFVLLIRWWWRRRKRVKRDDASTPNEDESPTDSTPDPTKKERDEA